MTLNELQAAGIFDVALPEMRGFVRIIYDGKVKLNYSGEITRAIQYPPIGASSQKGNLKYEKPPTR